MFEASVWRDPALAAKLSAEIRRLAGDGRFTLMEVCGTHTVAIARSGLRSLLPEGVRLISGPGCPVCVTPQGEVTRALTAAKLPGLALATFGDMLRVPGKSGSIESARSSGADIRVIYSPRQALELARGEPGRQFVLVGVGFETTIPAFAATLREAARVGIENLSVLNSFRLVSPALRAVADDPGIHGFILPGHVSAVLGQAPYEFLSAKRRAAVIAGFEPLDVLLAVKMLLEQVRSGRFSVEIAYRRAVRPEGNPDARRMIAELFEPCDAAWRGLGRLPESGLAFRSEWRRFDAAERFSLATPDEPEPVGCRCGEVLCGRLAPEECPLFGSKCTPLDPVGPCMVSSEGSCSARYRYRGLES